jgi:hypothetical protein
METTYFYHSFPISQNISTGLKILESILRNGFLLTAEIQRFAATRHLAEKTIVQSRACFTALPERELSAHAKVFGPFALEFEGQSLRDFGVLPVFYTAGRMQGGTLLHEAGQLLARHLLECHQVMCDLVWLGKHGDPAQQTVANLIWKNKGRAALISEELQYALEALMNLSYPTDEFGSGEFTYFKEREWRIVPNLALAGGPWIYPPPTAEQAVDLRAIDPKFFDEKIEGRTQLQRCAFLRDVHGNNVIKRVRRLVVPESVLDAGRQIAVRYGYAPDMVVSASEPE